MTRQKAIIVCGPPGAGKTTYGRTLAAETKSLLLDIDTATEAIVRAALSAANKDPDDRDSLWFKENFRGPIYDTLFRIAKENLVTHDVIVVGPFTREVHQTDWPEQLGQLLRAEVEVHYVKCDPKVRRQRMISRGEPRDLPKLKDWETFLNYYGEEAPPAFEHVLVDTSAK